MKKAVGIAGTVAAAALLLTACGSDGDDDKKDTPKDTSSASSAPAEGGADAKVSGTYVAKSGDAAVILSINGKKAILMAGKHICDGEYADMGGKMLMLKCADGNTDRSAGKVTPSADGKTLTVDWDALAKNDTFTRTTSPSDLPSGIPTSLPSGLPTDLPSGVPTDLPTDLPTG
ncbi:PT domain-containing protein [Streptomyces malaysiensis]